MGPASGFDAPIKVFGETPILFQDRIFNTAVLESSILSIVTGGRGFRPVAFDDQGAWSDTLADEESTHGIGALL